MEEAAIAVAVGAFFMLVAVLGIGAIAKAFYRKVEQGKALINNKMNKVEVLFTGGLVLPVIHRAEIMDISVKTIQIDRTSQEGLICQDNIRADIKVAFFVRVNKTQEDVLKVAQAIGCQRASDQHTLEVLFSAKFSEALKTVGKRMMFEDLYKERDHFKEQIIEVIGRDLNGYVLEDVAIDFLEQTPIEKLDEDNILDSQGIRKITELTAEQKVRTNHFQNTEKKQIKKQDVEAQEAILALERQQSDAEAKQKREIETVRAREEAEVAKVRAEEWQRSQVAKLKAEEEIQIQAENKQRQVEVAQKNRERVIKVETERVEKDRALEEIIRQREVALQSIAKEKAVEKERKEIQDVIRERIAVEKTVAEEEERIKDLRVVAEAKRSKEAVVIHAEAEAEEKLVKHLKEAEASEAAAKFKARERLVIADAELTAADKDAKSMARMAEGQQAEYAARGLAEARVQEAAAAALERTGLAEARAMQEKMKAEASGIEEQGLARMRVQEAEAVAIEKKGLAEARALQEKMKAEATGVAEQGLAKVRVEEAEASAIQKKGQAEAGAIQAKMQAEAAGLVEKASAMKTLDPASRAHEEFRLKLELERTLRLEGIHAQQEVAHAQAAVLAEAFKHASINIVGGDGAFFERFTGAIGLGRSIDGFVNSSDAAKAVLKDYLSGDGSLREDIKEVLTHSSISPSDLQNLTLSAFVTRLMAGKSDAQKQALGELIEKARGVGVE